MCYTVPIVAAVTTTFIWRKNRSVQMWWLILMFYGGSLFGFVDHLYNGELFLISKDWVKDLALGVVITAVIFLAWKTILVLAKRNLSLNAYMATPAKNR
jgi:hypothetical protein